MTNVSLAHNEVNRHFAREYLDLTGENQLGMWVWPGYEPRDPHTGLGTGQKVPAKAGHLTQAVSDLQRFTTFPEGESDWFNDRDLWRWRFVGHIPALARVPLLVVDCDTLDDAQFAEHRITQLARTNGELIPPIVHTGRGAHIYFRAPSKFGLTPDSRPFATTPRLTFQDPDTGMPSLQAEVLFFKWIVLPPSIHPLTRQPYQWGGGWSTTTYPLESIPHAPDWILSALEGYGERTRTPVLTITPAVEAAYNRLREAAGRAIRDGDYERALVSVLNPLLHAAKRSENVSDRGLEYIHQIQSWPPGGRHNPLQRLQWDLVGDLNTRTGRVTIRDVTEIAEAYIATQTSSGKSRDSAILEWTNLLYHPAAKLDAENEDIRVVADWATSKS